MKNKKGFTLIEVSVSIAVTLIAIAMVCTFIEVYNKNTHNLKSKDEFIQEISTAQTDIGDWIQQYDRGYYEISISDGGKGLTVAPTAAANEDDTIKSKLEQGGSIVFDDLHRLNKMSTSSDGTNSSDTTEYKVIKGMTFEFPKARVQNAYGEYKDTADDNKSLIICTVNDGKDTQKLVFSFHSLTVHNRFSSSNRIDIGKIQTATEEWLKEFPDVSRISAEDGSLIYNKKLINKILSGDAKLSFDEAEKKLCRYDSGNFSFSHTYYGLIDVKSMRYYFSEKDATLLCCDIEFNSYPTETVSWQLGD